MTNQPEVLEVDLGHLRMSALAWGPADGRLAVCLHGFPDSAWSWRSTAELLANNGFRVVAPFTRGYAPTDVPADGEYHIGALAYDAIALHACLEGGNDAVIVGHDWGSFTANALAAYPASPFGAYVAMSVPSVGAMRAKSHKSAKAISMFARQLRRSWYVMFFQLPWLPERVAGRVIPKLWRDWTPAGIDVSEGIADAQAALPTLARKRAALSYYRALARARRPSGRYQELHPYRFDLPRRPILHIQGAQDGAIQVEYADFLPDLLPAGSVVEILEGGHFLQLEQPQQVAMAILRFCDSVVQTEESL